MPLQLVMITFGYMQYRQSGEIYATQNMFTTRLIFNRRPGSCEAGQIS